jgi:hypothetical protein
MGDHRSLFLFKGAFVKLCLAPNAILQEIFEGIHMHLFEHPP